MSLAMQSLLWYFKSWNSNNDDDHSGLCAKCKTVFNKWYERDNWPRRGYPHHYIAGLEASARKGCAVCALFLQGLAQAVVEHLQQNRPRHKSYVHVWNDDPTIYEVKLDFWDSQMTKKTGFRNACSCLPFRQVDRCFSSVAS
jgi:hypothetical protein